MGSFQRFSTNYDQSLVGTFENLKVERSNLRFVTEGVDWTQDLSYRTVPNYPTRKMDGDDDKDGSGKSSVKPANSTLSNPGQNPLKAILPPIDPATGAIGKHTMTSKEQQDQAAVTPLPVSPGTGGADGFTPSAPLASNVFLANVELPSFVSQYGPPIRKPPPPLTARERLCRKEGLPLERPYYPSYTKAGSKRLNTPYHQAETLGICAQLIKQTDRVQKVVPKPLSVPLASTKQIDSVMPDSNIQVLNVTQAALQDLEKPTFLETYNESSENSMYTANEASTSLETSTDDNNETIVEANVSVSIAEPRKTRSKFAIQHSEWVNLILKHQRTALAMNVDQLFPDEEFSETTLFQLPSRLLEFGQSLAAFIGLPENRDHWYFVEVLPYFFRRQIDDIWVFQADDHGSADFVQCQRLDSAYIVMHDKSISNNTLAVTAQLYEAYMLP